MQGFTLIIKQFERSGRLLFTTYQKHTAIKQITQKTLNRKVFELLFSPYLFIFQSKVCFKGNYSYKHISNRMHKYTIKKKNLKKKKLSPASIPSLSATTFLQKILFHTATSRIMPHATNIQLCPSLIAQTSFSLMRSSSRLIITSHAKNINIHYIDLVFPNVIDPCSF